MLSLCCNVCRKVLEGAAFVSDCSHVFCVSCSTRSFVNGSHCPVCSAKLRSDQLQEIVIGVPPISLSKYLAQYLFQNSDLVSILNNCNRLRDAASSMTDFVDKQLYLIVEQEVDLKSKHMEIAESAQAELVCTVKHVANCSNESVIFIQVRTGAQLRSQLALSEQKAEEAEARLQLLLREMMDLREAYKEKSKKCIAWERVSFRIVVQLGESHWC